MTVDVSKLNPWTPRDRPSASKLNALLDEVQRLRRVVNTNSLNAQRNVGYQVIVGVVKEEFDQWLLCRIVNYAETDEEFYALKPACLQYHDKYYTASIDKQVYCLKYDNPTTLDDENRPIQYAVVSDPELNTSIELVDLVGSGTTVNTSTWTWGDEKGYRQSHDRYAWSGTQLIQYRRIETYDNMQRRLTQSAESATVIIDSRVTCS